MKNRIVCLIWILTSAMLSHADSTANDFMRQLSDWRVPDNPVHPRLYFSAQGMENLRSRYRTGDNAIAAFLQKCDSLIVRPMPDYSNFNLSRYKGRDDAEQLSFAFALTGNKAYAIQAKGVIRQMLQWKDWVYDEHKPLKVDLGVAGVAYILALCYDWLYPVLSENERQAIEDTIISQALQPFHKIYSEKSEEWTQVNHNWRSVICGEMGVVALALLGRAPDVKENLQFAVDGVAHVLNHGGTDGGWSEGVSYWGYGIGQAMMFVEAMYRVSEGCVDLYQLPFLRVTGQFGLYCRTPEGNNFNFSDSNPEPPKPWLMALLASHYQNSHWQWSAKKELGTTIPDILFFNKNLPSQKPAVLALGKHFRGIEVAAMRSSWDDDAIFVGLKSGRSAANHSHLDLNSFILHARGERLLIDQFNWPYAHYLGFFDETGRRWDFEGNHTIAHNTLLIDGQGQCHGETCEGRIVNFSSLPELQFVVGEAHSAYGSLIKKYFRYIALVDAKFVVVVDDIAADDLRKMEWLMHYEGDISSNQSGDFVVANDSVMLGIQFLKPDQGANRVISFRKHETSYMATREKAREVTNFLAVRPLHRQREYRFIVTALPYGLLKVPEYICRIQSENADALIINATLDGTTYTLNFDFVSHAVRLSK